MASVLMQHDDMGNMRLYNKGAAEWVIKRCRSLLNENGEIVPLTEERTAHMMEVITSMAKRVSICHSLFAMWAQLLCPPAVCDAERHIAATRTLWLFILGSPGSSMHLPDLPGLCCEGC
jgi:hypothetical protein